MFSGPQFIGLPECSAKCWSAWWLEAHQVGEWSGYVDHGRAGPLV